VTSTVTWNDKRAHLLIECDVCRKKYSSGTRFDPAESETLKNMKLRELERLEKSGEPHYSWHELKCLSKEN